MSSSRGYAGGLGHREKKNKNNKSLIFHNWPHVKSGENWSIGFVDEDI